MRLTDKPDHAVIRDAVIEALAIHSIASQPFVETVDVDRYMERIKLAKDAVDEAKRSKIESWGV